jgi:hypothetical protein
MVICNIRAHFMLGTEAILDFVGETGSVHGVAVLVLDGPGAVR